MSQEDLVPYVTLLGDTFVFGYAGAYPLKDAETRGGLVLVDARFLHGGAPHDETRVHLATTGPTPECRVGFRLPAVHLPVVGALVECTPEAASAWEVGYWAADE